MNIQDFPHLPDNAIGIVDLSRACAMSRTDLEELMDYGALQPLASQRAEPMFSLEWMQPLRIAGALRRDYDLDLFVVVIVMDYLRRIDTLESRVQSLLAQTGA